mmetsp:Transcript_23116/g.42891  ORF Transcript_23116/g.42891 Transcript_23116/m.42891 type:complete len:222 (+) Transcript_23116:736-1401(+)
MPSFPIIKSDRSSMFSLGHLDSSFPMADAASFSVEVLSRLRETLICSRTGNGASPNDEKLSFASSTPISLRHCSSGLLDNKWPTASLSLDEESNQRKWRSAGSSGRAAKSLEENSILLSRSVCSLGHLERKMPKTPPLVLQAVLHVMNSFSSFGSVALPSPLRICSKIRPAPQETLISNRCKFSIFVSKQPMAYQCEELLGGNRISRDVVFWSTRNAFLKC